MKALRVLLLAVCALAAPAYADLTITVSNDVTRPQPIAVVPFAQPPDIGVDVAQIVDADLARCGLFKTLPRNDMLERPTEVAQVVPRNWRAVGMDNVVIGKILPGPAPGSFTVSFRLIDATHGDDPNASVTLTSDNITARTKREWRSAAHQVADMIYEKLTGIRGIFNTQFAYVVSTGIGPSRRFQMLVADADAENKQTIAVSREPLMSPAWSPDGQRLAFVGYDHGYSAIYIQNWRSGELKKFVQERGINGAPSWSPDGSKLAVTLSFEKNPDIYVIDVNSGARNRITTDSGIDTEAAWSPDGRTLAWASDRGGQPQIYTAPSTGGPQTRLTFQGVRNEDPVYSPDGKTLALVNNDGSGYRIGLMNLQTGALRLISDGPMDEHPSFAPNGQVVIYTSQGPRGEELRTASVDGRVHQTLSEPGDVREPAWSPFPSEQLAH
ncbi:MAG: Tol-Pal system beta propeller repeat protein TolB [Nevskia sp.]|nr:Tol-Pal system beta propeller repeat protein TolB [Nevskia sp.]